MESHKFNPIVFIKNYILYNKLKLDSRSCSCAKWLFGKITIYPPVVWSKFKLPTCSFKFDNLLT